MLRVLTLRGHCPAKKNNWKLRAGFGIPPGTETAAAIKALILEAVYPEEMRDRVESGSTWKCR